VVSQLFGSETHIETARNIYVGLKRKRLTKLVLFEAKMEAPSIWRWGELGSSGNENTILW